MDLQLALAVQPQEKTGEEPHEVWPLVHEELDQLPHRYRAPIVLCHLQGKTHEQAARLLDWPVGTLSGRLSRARQLLRTRLERRGVLGVPALLAGTMLGGPLLPADRGLIDSTLQTALRFSASQIVSRSILTLTQGVLKTMLLRRLRTAAAVLLVGAVSGGAIVAAHRPAAPASHQERPTALASVSTPTPVDTTQSDSPGSSQDCFADGPPPWCPITMATNAVTSLVDHVHEWAGISR